MFEKFFNIDDKFVELEVEKKPKDKKMTDIFEISKTKRRPNKKVYYKKNK